MTLNGTAQTIGDLSGSAGHVIVPNGATLTIAETGDASFGGDFTGNGLIDYVGTGHLTIGGYLSTFNGAVTIDHGTLTLNGHP